MFMFKSLEQFEIFSLINLNIFTHLVFKGFILGCHIIISNFFLYSCICLISVYFFFKSSSYLFKILIPVWQSLIVLSYFFVLDLLKQQVGRVGHKFYVLIFSIFIFILIANMVGLIPYSFTTTSHISQTFTFSLSIFFGLTILGFVIQKLDFLQLFVPKGVPMVLLPFLVIIEALAYISRAFSLAIRLFANMMSGHTLLHILSGFSVTLYNKYMFHDRILSFIPFFVVLIILGLEVCIAFLQAYVFAVLVCIYLGDSHLASH